MIFGFCFIIEYTTELCLSQKLAGRFCNWKVSGSFLELTDSPFKSHTYVYAHFSSESQETGKTFTFGDIYIHIQWDLRKLGIHPSMVRNKTINQGKGNRVISILYFCDSIFLNCLGKLYVKVKVRVLILYFMFEHLILIKWQRVCGILVT